MDFYQKVKIYLQQSFVSFWKLFLFGKHQILLIDKMHARNRFCWTTLSASIVIMNKRYARNRLCRTIISGQHSDYEKKIMPIIGFVDKMYAKNRLC